MPKPPAPTTIPPSPTAPPPTVEWERSADGTVTIRLPPHAKASWRLQDNVFYSVQRVVIDPETMARPIAGGSTHHIPGDCPRAHAMPLPHAEPSPSQVATAFCSSPCGCVKVTTTQLLDRRDTKEWALDALKKSVPTVVSIESTMSPPSASTAAVAAVPTVTPTPMSTLDPASSSSSTSSTSFPLHAYSAHPPPPYPKDPGHGGPIP